MRTILSCTFLAITAIVLTTSCTKTKVEIETVTVKDTVSVPVPVPAIDTTFAMDVSSWNAYSYSTNVLINPGTSTYFNTAEGIKAISQGYRYGIRLQTKTEVGFKNKNLYYKWKANSGGQFAQVVPQVKYDPTVTDNVSAPQGFDWTFFNLYKVEGNFPLVQNDTWYYTRAAFVQGTDNYQVITATGNYDNKGGTVINTVQKKVYTKSGFPSIRIGDPFGGSNAYFILGEFKISSN